MINFDVTEEESQLVTAIADRILRMDPTMASHYVDLCMDLTATHANGCPLDLQGLLGADDFDLFHDISGIAKHFDRTTGKLTGCFLPRYAKKKPLDSEDRRTACDNAKHKIILHPGGGGTWGM